MEKHCIACGMPLNEKEDITSETDEGPACKYCVDSSGKVKSCKEIFEGGVQFFMNSVQGVDKSLAERITRKNMNRLPYWKNKDEECLKGEEASDEEFEKALNDLHKEIDKSNVKE